MKKPKKYKCNNCLYTQDFEPTKEAMMKIFKRESDICPSCNIGQIEKLEVKA